MAQHLLAGPGLTILDLRPPVAIPSRLSEHQPFRPHLPENPLEYHCHALQAPHLISILSDRLLRLYDVYFLLDDPHLSLVLPSVLLFPYHNRPLRPHRYRRNVLWPCLLSARHRSLRSSLLHHPWFSDFHHRHRSRHIHRHIHRRGTGHSGIFNRFRITGSSNCQPLFILFH